MLCATLILSISWAAAPLDELTPPPWPAGMKQERTADGGAKLNAIAADAVHEHLEWGERVPELTRVLIDSSVREAVAVRDEEHRVDTAQQAARINKLEQNQITPFRTMKVVGATAVVTAVLVIVGREVLQVVAR